MSAADPIDIEIQRTAGRFNLGVAAFNPQDKSTDQKRMNELRDVIIADLTFSKNFNLVTEGPGVVKNKDVVAWGKIGSDSVLAAHVKIRPGSDVDISARLIDVGSAKENLSIRKKGSVPSMRALGHEVANEIVKFFTGQAGIFTSKIAFVNDVAGRKELFLMDYDGKNARRLTNDNSIVILPRISWDGQKVIFTSYVRGNPDLYIMNRDGSGRQRISEQSGLNVSPSWAPNGEEFALTLSINGPPNIYLMDKQGHIKRRVTDSQEADTAPSFSPDGSQLVFTSDRAGSPHIYIMNLDGTGLRRLTTAGHCDSAAWSPDGQTIVYVKGQGSDPFDIYSIEVQTGIERRLTWAKGNSENPTWSPDGRFIAFVTSRRGKYELFVMAADGSDQRPLFTNNGQTSTPHWSN